MKTVGRYLPRQMTAARSIVVLVAVVCLVVLMAVVNILDNVPDGMLLLLSRQNIVFLLLFPSFPRQMQLTPRGEGVTRNEKPCP